MTDERVEPTKEWMDALIDEIVPPNFPTTEAQRWAMRKLRDAILASQPERVEPTDDFVRQLSGIRPCLGTEFCRTHDQYLSDCVAYFEQEKQRITAILASQPERVECPTKHGKFVKKWVPDGSGNHGWLKQWSVFTPHKTPFCPDCGQSLKGAK